MISPSLPGPVAARLPFPDCKPFRGRVYSQNMTLKIDGSMGEGGGQVLRSALTLSAVTGKAFRMERIRAGRRKPGLAAQHLACVHGAARISNAKVTGDRAGSGEISFAPKRVRPGQYGFRIRTAGSAALLAQTVVLPLALAGEGSRLTLGGGTHVPWSPAAGYLDGVWAPALDALGLRFSAELKRAGFYPKGGGGLELTVRPARKPLMPLDAEALAALDYTVLPDGDGLPPGAGTARAGADVFRQHCIACHGADGEGAVNDALVGGQGSLASDSPQKTVGSFWPYATTVFDYIRRAMPYQAPGTLDDDEIYAVTAYVLYLNGIVSEDDRIDQKTLPLVKMPNREGFTRAWPP